jgi:hypothetical protein
MIFIDFFNFPIFFYLFLGVPRNKWPGIGFLSILSIFIDFYRFLSIFIDFYRFSGFLGGGINSVDKKWPFLLAKKAIKCISL